ncbi:tauropine dehydrogenase-like isoform X2 [Oculina patagonica]
MNSKDSSSNADNPPANNHPPTEGSTNWRNVAVGVAAGTAAVVAGAAAVAAAPVVLGAAGFTAGGVAVAGNAAIAGVTGGITALGARMFNSRKDIKLLICGSGSEAQAFAGIASSLKDTEVRVLTYQNAELWNTAMRTNGLKVTFHRKGKTPTSFSSKPALITGDSEVAMRDVDIVVFVLPAFAHELYLDAIKPYIRPGTIIVGLPGGPGFEFQVREVLGDVARQCFIVNFESSPWVCRITEFDVNCEVLGTKETLQGAMKQGEGVAPKKDPVSTLQNLLGPLPKLNVSGHLLGVTLMSTDAYLHPSILYGQWNGWDRKPLDEPPLFYNGLTESAANLLSRVSDEIVNIGKAVELQTKADMSNVVHIHQWHVRRYPHDISNKLSLYEAIQTNAAYQGIKHPVKTTEDGKYMPDFTYRYMTEDIPCGLVVIRGIAEIADVKTPNIDKVLTWCQKKMGKEYLVNSKLQGKDVASSRAPQRYGLNTLQSML